MYNNYTHSINTTSDKNAYVMFSVNVYHNDTFVYVNSRG